MISDDIAIDFFHLEELEKKWKDQEVCDDGADCPSSGEVSIVYHVDPILQSGLIVIVVNVRCTGDG